MKKKKETGNFTDKDWARLASVLSGERNEDKDILARFGAEDRYDTINKWKESEKMNTDKEINVDKAWDRLHSRLEANGLINNKDQTNYTLSGTSWLRIAATILILLSLGAATIMIISKDKLTRKVIAETSVNQKNLEVTLPDGSNVFLNRNTKLTYNKNFGKHGRKVALQGEAFFDIAHDRMHPFIVEAGKARVKVVGTSFNVTAKNDEASVEVFVRTGKVLLTDDSGLKSIELDPGYVGKIDGGNPEKTVNKDPNYLSWNTGLLVYDGQTLDIVFRDLKKVYDMDIVADDPSILEKTWTSPIDNQPQDTIIRLICASFNLGFTKVGNVYHLSPLR